MSVWTGVLRVLAETPAVVLSTALTCIIGALLPDPAGLALFVAGLVVTAALCLGAGEDLVVRLVHRSRRLSAGEAAALEPTLRLLCERGLTAPPVTVWVSETAADTTATAAHPFGTHSVLLNGHLIQELQDGRLRPEQAAGVIAAALGWIRCGLTRFDLALGFWTAPWHLLRVVVEAVAAVVAWFPLTRLAWRLRIVVATIAVVQAIEAGRQGSGIVVAVMFALTYLVPLTRRAWQCRAQRRADAVVVEHGLGDALAGFLCSSPFDADTRARIHHLDAAQTPPVGARPLAVGTTT